MSLALPPCQLYKNLQLNFADGWRYRHTDRLKHFAAYAFSPAADRRLCSVFLNMGFLQGLQVLFDMRPFKHMAGFFQMTLKFFTKDQRKKAAKKRRVRGWYRPADERQGGFQEGISHSGTPVPPATTPCTSALNFAEQIPPNIKQVLFDQILVAPWRKSGGAGLIRQGLPQEGHRAIKMVQLKSFGAGDGVIPPPAITIPVRTRR